MRVLRRVPTRHSRRMPHRRSGAVSTIDYVLVIAVVFPLAAFAIPMGKRIIELTWEMMCVLVSWPFM